MKTKAMLLVTVLFVTSLRALGQDEVKLYGRLYLKPAFGLNIPFTRMLDNSVTHSLIGYDDNSWYWQFISASYFFSKHWGAEFTFQGKTSGALFKRADTFNSRIEEAYSDRFYVGARTGASYKTFNMVSGDFESGYLGVVYRWETSKLLLMPKLFWGVTSFYTDWGEAYLKERNSNNVYRLRYHTAKLPRDHHYLAPAVTMGYKLTDRLTVNLDLLYSGFRTSVSYTETLVKLDTEETQAQEYSYNKRLRTLTLGTGLLVRIK